MNYRVDLAVLSEQNGVSRFGLTLHNLSDQDLSGWALHFSLDRYILADTLSQGVIDQVGSHCVLSPSDEQSLSANHHYYIEFSVNTSPFRYLADGIDDAYLEVRDGDNVQNLTVDITPIALMSPYKKRESTPQVEAADFAIIPKPASFTAQDGYFSLSDTSGLNVTSTLASNAVEWLKQEVQSLTGISLKNNAQGGIVFRSNPTLDKGHYCLKIREKSITLESGSRSGFVHACASLLQLISAQKVSSTLPSITIKDSPRYGYRGMMLDCARHFHSVAQVKQLINHLAYYKFNYFHWHLTDDEGWRLEIKAFPELTQTGSKRGPETQNDAQYSHLSETYGGYYTQEEVQEVIEYAATRSITVIPEIDIPGHCRAAIKALPELLVDPQDSSEYLSIQNYNDNVLSPALDGTYQFLDTVLTEVAGLFPSQYVHIGADEVPKNVWTESPKCQAMMKEHGYTEASELQGHLLRHAERKLKSLGKRMLGWEEAKHGNKVSKDTVIFAWMNEEAALQCAQQGFDIVLQPAQTTYLDMTQDYAPEEPGVDWANPVPLEMAYQYEPLNSASENDPVRQRIWGVQCALWCEKVTNQSRLEYMVFPRLTALAEVCWSQAKDRNWLDYLSRLKGHLPHWQRLGVNYRSPWQE
ncbi:beta-N-acetylhexosaminidase [Vibrio nigripulchritudo]|uniref:beta-N-acetylhexosaminidase n=1 Tax=Vibrio nigripulchritudo TaxID=28173 RepID=UPI0003B237D1|nr:family 20 glycosylhydrolase [Vibrio nigripulchritudo]CCN69052.1 Beta-hexosaminidase [Vibrio nigripulchritudo SFn118]